MLSVSTLCTKVELPLIKKYCSIMNTDEFSPSLNGKSGDCLDSLWIQQIEHSCWLSTRDDSYTYGSNIV